MNTVFGPVLVASKKLVPSGVHVAVTLLQQEIHNNYTLADALSGNTTKAPPSTTRKATVRVFPAEAACFQEGKPVPGHIQRTIYVHPKYPGQQEAFTGGYPQAQWVPEYQPDIDLRNT